MKKPPREERFRAREWERQARAAQMSSSAVDQDGASQSEFLFKEPVKVSPSSKDRVSHAIHNTLGPYDHVRNYLDKDSSGLIGVDGVPPSPAPAVHYSPPFNGSTASRLQASPDARHEFKKPHQQMHPPPLTHQRGGYVKPTEGKPPYGGRGSYPGQPVKRGAGGAGGHSRTNGIVPAKGPPPAAALPSNVHRHPFEMNQPPVTAPRESLPSATPGPQDVDNIFKEMRMPTVPVSAIAATPRIDTDNKYQYNPLVKMPEPLTPLIKKRERPTTSRLPSTDLHNELDLSEDSDDESKKGHHILSVDKMLSPIHQTPAPHQSSKYCASERIPTFAPVEPTPPPPPPAPVPNVQKESCEHSAASSSSDSGSDSGESDSDSSSDDSTEERITSQAASVTSPSIPPQPRPEQQETSAQSPHRNDEQESRTRWNLASFVNNQTETVKSQGSPTTSPTKSGAVMRASPDSRKRPAESASDSDGACSDSDRVMAEAQQLIALFKRPILNNLSDSDNKSDDAVRRKKRQRTHRVPPQSRARLSESDDSDSERPAERSSPSKVAPKPVVRPSPRTKSTGFVSDSDAEPQQPPPPSAKTPTALPKTTLPAPVAVADLSDSDSDHRPASQPVTGPKISPVGEPPPKPKGRGRPRKIKTEGSEGEAVKKQRGRPRMSKEGEVKKTGKRGRPPKIRQSAPPSSSDDDAFGKNTVPARKAKSKKEEYSTDSDSPRPSPVRRRTGYRQDSDRDSIPFHNSPSKKKTKTPRGPDDHKKSKPESDEEWVDRNKDRVKALFQDSRSDRSESESSSRRKREKPKEATSPFRRKGAKTQEYKSVAFIPTSNSSDSDETASRSTTRPRKSSASEHQMHRISDSDSDADVVPPKLEKVDEHKAIADKNKSDTLRKLFTPKRDTEGGGKGGGKGGKGGKGKAGVNVIIVDGDSERTSSSVEDEAVPSISNANLLSPIPANADVKPLAEPQNKPKPASPNVVKTENVSPVKIKSGLVVSIDFSRFNIDEIPKLKQHLQTTKPWLLEQRKGSKVKSELSDIDTEDKPLDSSLESRKSTMDGSKLADSKRMKKRKRKNSASSVSSLSTVSNISHASKKDKEKEYKDKSKHKSKRKKDEHSLSKMPPVRTQTENLNCINTPPTNHERDRLAPGLDSIIAASTSKGSPVVRVYYSYFEDMQEYPEKELRDQNHYLTEAQRLKQLAVKEKDTINQCLLYLEAVLYFLLSGNAMEQENFNDQTTSTMYINTLSLIKYISNLTNDITSSLSIRSKLAILTYRCQALLYFKMFKMKKQECMESQKIIAEHCSKTDQPCPGQGTPSPLSPTPSPAGSVNSVGSQSSGYSSGELTSKAGPSQQSGLTAAGCTWVPLPVYNAMVKQNQQFSYLLNYQVIWETADEAVIKGGHTEFFVQLDRYCKPLTMHSSLIQLVRYVQEGIKMLKKEVQEASSNYS